jgi:hypothetical protein
MAQFDMPPASLSHAQSPWLDHGWVEHSQILLNSYRKWTGRDLIPRVGSPLEQAQALFEVPFVVVSHGIQADPILNYGNQTALNLWNIEIEALLKTPSRQTAEPVHRDERALLLERTARDGYVDDYQGIRIATDGRRFRINQALVWNLVDQSGNRVGQAATFSDWQFLDSPK